MDETIEKTIKALKRNGFDAYYAGNSDEANRIIQELIPVSASIGIGDSATLRQIGIAKLLQREGRFLLNPFSDEITQWMNEGKINGAQFMRFCRMALECDYFITGTNILTETGILMNTDCAGNRVAGMFFGPFNSIMVVGRNKIVPDVESGYDRLRNICGAMHSKTKERKNPCVKTGRCMDCNSPDRLCRVTTILEKNPKHIKANVIIIDEDYGLGWDPEWQQERIDRIYENYAGVTKMKRPEWMDELH